MSVYVDPLINYGWVLGPSCHLTADSEDELHEFAKKIGMKREWFQKSACDIPHYDLTASKRRLAVNQGAVEITIREAGMRVRKFIDKIKDAG